MTKSQGSGVGKYSMKGNADGEAAPGAAHHRPHLGVRTRAKTLAIRRLQESSPEAPSSYLQLRSRRLENQLLSPSSARSRAVAKNRPTANPSPGPNLSSGSNREARTREEPSNSGSAGSMFFTSRGLRTKKTQTAGSAVAAEGFGKSWPEDDAGVEASSGENAVDLDTCRSTRETTPCSLIRAPEPIGTPSSTTRTTKLYVSNKKRASPSSSIPSALQMEELFAGPERLQQQSFIEKYNFDVVKDEPLPGRYEWLILDS